MENICFNLGDRQQKILPKETVLNQKSSRSSLKLAAPVLTVSWWLRRAIVLGAAFLLKRIARANQARDAGMV
ncbi:hypothetical protein QUA43_22920 [Microcoleus sp. N9_B4]